MQINDILQVLPLFLNHSNAAVAIKDINGYYLLANDEFARYAGQPLNLINGNRDQDFLSNERVEKIKITELSAISRFKGVNCVEEFSMEGQEVYYIATRFPIVDEHRHMIGLGIVAMDVTEQHRSISEAERALQAAEQVNAQLREVVENLEQLASTDRLTKALEGKKPFRRFKDTVYDYPDIQDKWYQFEDAALTKMTETWCEENDIEFEWKN